MDRNALMAASADLRARLAGQSAPAPHGEPLPLSLARRLDAMIAETPDASHRAIAARFARETGRQIPATTVARRRPPRPEARRSTRFTPDQEDLLLELVRVAGPEVSRAEVARRFEDRTGRAISTRTVSAYAVHRLGLPSRNPRPAPASRWPAWTDMAFDLAYREDDTPWREDDRVTLGPVVLIGGGR